MQNETKSNPERSSRKKAQKAQVRERRPRKEKKELKKALAELEDSSKIGGFRGREAELINRELHRAAKVSVPRSLPTSLHRWLRAASRPFEGRGVPCPVNFAPAPSMMSTTATITNDMLSLTVAANTSLQILLWPGHGAPPVGMTNPQTYSAGPPTVDYDFPTSAIDSVAFHARLQNVNGLPYSAGPLNEITGVVKALIGTYNNGLTGGAVNTGPTAVPIEPANQLPYKMTLSETAQGHVRWRLDSMGIRIVNTTAEINRGGSIRSVQFANSQGLIGGNIVDSEINPTFRLWDKDRVEIAWIPRPQDLAFWHSVGAAGTPGSNRNTPAITDANAFNQTDEAAALCVYVDAGSTAQTISWQIIQNYSLAGNLVNVIAGPAPTMPEAKPVIEHTLVEHQNFASTFSSAAGYGAQAAAAIHQGSEVVHGVVNQVGKAAGLMAAAAASAKSLGAGFVL